MKCLEQCLACSMEKDTLTDYKNALKLREASVPVRVTNDY